MFLCSVCKTNKWFFFHLPCYHSSGEIKWLKRIKAIGAQQQNFARGPVRMLIRLCVYICKTVGLNLVDFSPSPLVILADWTSWRCADTSPHVWPKRAQAQSGLLTLWMKYLTTFPTCVFFLTFYFWRRNFPASAAGLKTGRVPAAAHSPTLSLRAVVVVVFINSHALWLVLSLPRFVARELARRAHAAEWLERVQRFWWLQQRASVSVLQPAARCYYTGKTLHSGETDAASTQSDGGILGRRGHRETERCHVQLGLCGGWFPKAGLPLAEPHPQQAAPLPAERAGAGGRPLSSTVLYMENHVKTAPTQANKLQTTLR